MTESLSKAAESLENNRMSESGFDPDKKAEISETQKPEGKEDSFDPDKKAEVSFLQNDSRSSMADSKDGESDEPRRIQTRNEDFAGKKHPVTDVPFEEKTVQDKDGNEVTGVFPVFESDYDAQLPKDLYQASDKDQFSESNGQLKKAVEKDPDLAKKFTPEQLEQIKNGDTPDGYTWHHNEETGKMQLVNSETHAKTGHTGGKSIWGGGTENR